MTGHCSSLRPRPATRAAALLMVLALLLTLVSLPAGAAGWYGRVLSDGVNVRATPGENGPRVSVVEAKTVMPIRESATVNDVLWYCVTYTAKDKTGKEMTGTGWINGDFFYPLTPGEATQYEKDGTLGTRPSIGVKENIDVVGEVYGRVVGSEVNFREAPSMRGRVLFQVNRGDVVRVFSYPPENSEDPWYHVLLNGQEGYIQGDFVRLSASASETSWRTPTPAPTATPTATPFYQILGYVKTITSNVNVRLQPEINPTNSFRTVGKNLVLPYISNPIKPEGDSYWWYEVVVEGDVGYIRGDLLTECDEKGREMSATSTPVVTATPKPAGHFVKTITDNVNLRSEPRIEAGNSIGKIRLGTVMAYSDSPLQPSGDRYTWYYVNANGLWGYVRSDVVQECNEDGSAIDAPTSVPVTLAPTAVVTTPSAVTPTPHSASGWVKVTGSTVNVRNDPSTATGTVVARVTRGQILPYAGTPTRPAGDSRTWYFVSYGSGWGYIRSDLVQECNEDGSAIGTVTPVPVITEVPVTAPPVITEAPAASGYVKTIKGSVVLRAAPSVSTGARITAVAYGVVMPYAALVQPQGETYSWYYVEYNGTWGYMRADCVQPCDEHGGPISGPTAVPTGTTPTPTSPSYVTPTPTQQPVVTETPAASGYVKTIKGSVVFRSSPAISPATWLATVPYGTVMPHGGAVRPSGDTYSWYYVEYQGTWGYMRADCVRECNADGTDITAPTVAPTGSLPTATPTLAPVTEAPAVSGYVRITGTSVNVRSGPSVTSPSLGTALRGTVLPFAGLPVQAPGESNYWYFVRFGNQWGYVRNDYVTECNADGSDLVSPTATAIVPTPTSTGPEPTPTLARTGFVRVTVNSVNVRSTPQVTAGNIITQARYGSVMAFYGQPVIPSGSVYSWYYVRVGSTMGYIRSDYLRECNPDGSDIVTPTAVPGTPTPTPVITAPPTEGPVVVGYVRTTATIVLREAPQGTTIETIAISTVLPVVGDTVRYSGYTWYPVVSPVSGRTGYLRGDYLLECDEYGRTFPPVTPTPTAEPVTTATPTPTPTQGTVTGYVKIRSYSANVRSGPSTAYSRIGTVYQNTVLAYYGAPVAEGSYLWYNVSTSFGMGYVRSDLIILTDMGGDPITTATPTVAPTPTYDPANNEAEYFTLSTSSAGYLSSDLNNQEVTRLTRALKNQGYYSGSVTSSYTSAVASAVSAFERAIGVTADGIAWPSVQHALYGTRPYDPGVVATLTMDIYPAEKIDWYTGGIQDMWPKGANMKIYDVYTGIVWWAHRWSGGQHADIEPLTAADTARLCQAYGVSTAEELQRGNKWERRPCLVTIGNRTFACSLYGIPHNPEGDTISNNNMGGQICLHFTNSRTHGTNIVEENHVKAIQYAWEHAPQGHK